MVQADSVPADSNEKFNSASNDCCQNTDTHLWPIVSDEYFPDRLHITASGALGINCGGLVIVKPIREWHALAAKELASPPGAELNFSNESGSDAVSLKQTT